MSFTALLIFVAFFNLAYCNEFIESDEPVNIIAIGDWGGTKTEPYTTKPQLNVAKGMQSYSELNDLSFVLSLGDNIYPAGVSSLNDIRFEKTYKNVYRKHKMENTSWYLVMGNHDHRKNNRYAMIRSFNFSFLSVNIIK